MGHDPAPACTRVVEPLERRVLLAAAAAATAAPAVAVAAADFATLGDDGLLVVQGTQAADVITVARVSGNDITVTLGADSVAFPSGRVARLRVEAGGGDDRVELTPELKLRSILLGAGGNDTLLGGDQDDVLDGGDGADQLAGGGGQDTLLGGAGDDSIDGGDGRDEIHGGDGNDQITAGDGRDLIFGDDGQDRFATFDDRIDTIFGGNGPDLLFADRPDLNQPRKHGDVWSEVETVFY